jgi:hypothetical protein
VTGIVRSNSSEVQVRKPHPKSVTRSARAACYAHSKSKPGEHLDRSGDGSDMIAILSLANLTGGTVLIRIQRVRHLDERTDSGLRGNYTSTAGSVRFLVGTVAKVQALSRRSVTRGPCLAPSGFKPPQVAGVVLNPSFLYHQMLSS